MQLWEVKRDQEEVEPIGQNRSMVGWSGQFQSPSSMVEVQKGRETTLLMGRIVTMRTTCSPMTIDNISDKRRFPLYHIWGVSKLSMTTDKAP